MSSLKWLPNERKKLYLKALSWLELAEDYLNLVIEYLCRQNKRMSYLLVAF